MSTTFLDTPSRTSDRRSMFLRAFGPPTTAPPAFRDDPELLARCTERLSELEAQLPLHGMSFRSLLTEYGISRRHFLEWVSATTAMLMLPPIFEPLVARAAEVASRLPVIWLEGQDCAGNSEALLHATGPSIDELLFNVISLEYHETVMAAAGFQADDRMKEAASTYKGGYLLVVEGAIPRGENGGYCTIGPDATPFIDEVKALSADAAAVVAVGACAFYGGIPEASPNPTDAVGVSSVVKGKPLVNLPACPMNPANFNGTVLHFLLTGGLPELDSQLRPKFAFGYRIHDNCERRAHFDAGEYVQRWGDEGARNNFCLYKMGCKGPMTFNNCSIVRYNEGTNWPIGVGHGCIGCSEIDFWDRYATERPISDSHVSFPGLFGTGVEADIDKFGVGLLAVAGVGMAMHAALTIGAKMRNKPEGEIVPGSAAPPAATAAGTAPDSGPPAGDADPGSEA